MTNAVQSDPIIPNSPDALPAAPQDGGIAPASWQELRENSDIQFEPVSLEPEPAAPGWLAEFLGMIFEGLAYILGPIAQLLAYSWPVLQWVLLGGVIVFVIYLVARTIGPLARNKRTDKNAQSEPEWQPNREESLALLEDADRLAEQGRFDEATHLLLKRSVGQIAKARPEWVEPSSTARELAALPTLSAAAREAFAIISQRVENSLFALQTLDRHDWEAARSAYSNFALARLEAPGSGAGSAVSR